MAGKYLNKDNGFKDDPSPWKTNALHMKYLGGKHPYKLTEITEINFSVLHPAVNKTIIIDNVRLVENPEIPEDYLVGIVDGYGQPAKKDYEAKIYSDKQLKELAVNELAILDKEGPMTGRSKYGGWLNGPKQNGTGYFRVGKVGSKFTLIDPDGYLFFSHGIANARMSNTTTFTGRDFKNDEVRKDEQADVTPEDSKGMIALKKAVTTTSFVAHPERYAMFVDLPTYDSPLANHYSYRKEHYLSPFKQGETFSHYQANLERKYGEITPGAHLTKWKTVTLDRFLNWRFTSIGNWTGVEFYHQNKMPYFANGWIIGDFKTVPSGYWGGVFPDVFDKEFEYRAEVTVKNIANEVKNNPCCIGVFIDNEKNWGLPGSLKGHYGIVIEALKLNATESPTKMKFVTLLQSKYTSINKLNKAWETHFTSWEVLMSGVDLTKKDNLNKKIVRDFSELLELIASKYFEITKLALKKHMPNHLYTGCRFAAWGMNQEVVKAAKKHVDVMSYNYYEETIGSKHWDFLKTIDMPSIIGEFHAGVVGPDTFNAGLVMAANAKDRARMYTKYMESVIDNNYFVGGALVSVYRLSNFRSCLRWRKLQCWICPEH
ncbi:beta-galactosidase [Aquimarina agarivorans]|uniref:beta-galactosidase n=1 Tax=Aquimarina agarivorans TaxID=980584 RepID=UPI000248E6A3|nr:beta-galactosidase [Aquimarina agarivorans]